jgi:hypothetical protein
MNAIKKIGIAVAVALAANLASAAPGGKFGAADGNRDVNKDGVVSRAEVKGFRNAKRVAKGVPPKV